MNTFSKAVFSTTLLASLSEAKPIFNSCLRLSDSTAGFDDGQFISNVDQLTNPDFTDDMRLHGIKTCHTDGDVTGLQFFMAQDPYLSVGEEAYPMMPIGPMTGQCDYLELKEGLDEIKATLRKNESGLSMQYRIEDSPNEMQVKYGRLKLIRRTKWEFSDANPLVGVYGRQTATGITQLGFITLSTACQAAHDFVIDPVDTIDPDETTDPIDTTDPFVPVDEPEDPEPDEKEDANKPQDTTETTDTTEEQAAAKPEDVTETQEVVPIAPNQVENLDLQVTVNVEPGTTEEQTSEISLVTIILITVGAIVGITILIVTLCTLKYRKTNENKFGSTPTATPNTDSSPVKRRTVLGDPQDGDTVV